MKKKTVLIVVILILAWLFFRRPGRKEQKPELREPSAYLEEPSIKKIDPSMQMPSKKDEEVLLKRTKIDLKERQIELKRLPLIRKEQNSVLNVEIRMKPNCRPGDADAIQMDLKAAPDHKVMATLEPLGSNYQSFHWDFPSDFVSQGSIFNQFLIPQEQKPTLWGFYVCTADLKDTSCKNKATTDINDIFKEHITKSPKAGRQKRNIFFQVFLLDDWGLVAFADVPKESKRFEALKKYAGERGIASKESEQALNTSQKQMETLLSLPFSFNGNKLTVNLPKYRISACSKNQ